MVPLDHWYLYVVVVVVLVVVGCCSCCGFGVVVYLINFDTTVQHDNGFSQLVLVVGDHIYLAIANSQ